MYVLLYCGVCTGVRLLPPGENPIAVRNNNNNNSNNNNKIKLAQKIQYAKLHPYTPHHEICQRGLLITEILWNIVRCVMRPEE
jgi:hypothetical protein